MAMVMRVVSRQRSTVAPSVQVSAPRWAEVTMQSAKQAICAGGKIGAMSLRCLRQSCPRLVNRPSPPRGWSR